MPRKIVIEIEELPDDRMGVLAKDIENKPTEMETQIGGILMECVKKAMELCVEVSKKGTMVQGKGEAVTNLIENLKKGPRE